MVAGKNRQRENFDFFCNRPPQTNQSIEIISRNQSGKDFRSPHESPSGWGQLVVGGRWSQWFYWCLELSSGGLRTPVAVLKYCTNECLGIAITDTRVVVFFLLLFYQRATKNTTEWCGVKAYCYGYSQLQSWQEAASLWRKQHPGVSQLSSFWLLFSVSFLKGYSTTWSII